MRDSLPDARHRAQLRVVCVGNRWRSDDGAGLEVARRLEGSLPPGVTLVAHEGEPTALLDAWDGADELWLVDAVSSGAEPGTIHRLDAGASELPAAVFRASTHHVGLAEAVELARALGRLPARTVVYGIEGGSFEVGETLSPAVAAAVERVSDDLRAELLSRCR